MTLRSSIPVLAASDYPRAKAFWTKKLGFEVAEEGGDPARFGIFKSGAATVFVDAWHGGPGPEHGSWRVYFHVDDVDKLADRIGAAGLVFDGPRDTVYDMRELTLRDPDGNLLCFGADLG